MPVFEKCLDNKINSIITNMNYIVVISVSSHFSESSAFWTSTGISIFSSTNFLILTSIRNALMHVQAEEVKDSCLNLFKCFNIHLITSSLESVLTLHGLFLGVFSWWKPFVVKLSTALFLKKGCFRHITCLNATYAASRFQNQNIFLLWRNHGRIFNVAVTSIPG